MAVKRARKTAKRAPARKAAKRDAPARKTAKRAPARKAAKRTTKKRATAKKATKRAPARKAARSGRRHARLRRSGLRPSKAAKKRAPASKAAKRTTKKRAVKKAAKKRAPARKATKKRAPARRRPRSGLRHARRPSVGHQEGGRVSQADGCSSGDASGPGSSADRQVATVLPGSPAVGSVPSGSWPGPGHDEQDTQWTEGPCGAPLLASRASADAGSARTGGPRPAGMSAGTSTSQVSSGSRTTRQRRPRRCASSRWRAKEPGPVVEAEARPGGHAHHVGAVVAAIGTRVTPVEPGQLGHLLGEGQIGVRHEDLGGPGRRQPLDAGLHRPVEAASGLGEHHGAVVARPAGHLGVVAHHRHRKRRAAARTRAAMTRARASRPAASSVGARRALASPKAFTGTSTTQPVRGGRRTGAAVTRPVYGAGPRRFAPGCHAVGLGACWTRWRSSARAHGARPWPHWRRRRPRRCCGRAGRRWPTASTRPTRTPTTSPASCSPTPWRATASLERGGGRQRAGRHGRAVARVPCRAGRAVRLPGARHTRCCRWPRASSRAPTCA